MIDETLTDEQVYDLLHQALLLLSYRKVSSPEAQIILTRLVLEIENSQRALLIATERET